MNFYRKCLNFEETDEGNRCIAKIDITKGCPLDCAHLVHDGADESDDGGDEEG